jgi:glutamine amidotransferase
MIAIVDYDAGNTRNVQKSLVAVGLDSTISSDPEVIRAAHGLILPGVGAFSLAMKELRKRRLVDLLKDEIASGKALLGICLGMQLLLEGSEEHGYSQGLGFIPGVCKELPRGLDAYPVPHMGWNNLSVKRQTPLTSGLENKYVYFAHSYIADVSDNFIDSAAHYSKEIPAMIHKNNVYGIQFHPEKSGDVGLSILKRFKEVVANANTAGN